jgi:hypothetical protein
MARPKKVIDPETVEKLASMGLSAELIAAVLDCTHHTIERRFGPILKKGRQKRDSRLWIKLYQEAMGTPCNTAIAIFLAKNWLGMQDRPEIVINNVQQNSVMASIPEDRLLQYRRLVLEFTESEAAAAKQQQAPELPPASEGDVTG